MVGKPLIVKAPHNICNSYGTNTLRPSLSRRCLDIGQRTNSCQVQHLFPQLTNALGILYVMRYISHSRISWKYGRRHHGIFTGPWNPQHKCGMQHIKLKSVHSLVVYFVTTSTEPEHAVAQLFETLYSKLKGRGFHSRWGHWILNWPNPSCRNMALGSNRNEYQESSWW
jgi:hypothetical protein